MRQPRYWGTGVLLVLLGSAVGLGQEREDPAAQREAMKKLEFLSGEWKGQSWIEFVPGQRSASAGTETVETRLDGLLLTLEGIHRRKIGDRETDEIVHSAFTVVSYDDKAKRYRFQAYTGRGNYTEAEAKVGDGQLQWTFRIPQLGEVRYTISVDKGRWSEIGEMSPDGQQWRKFFEMNLERVKAGGKGSTSDK
jgi:hypothetical protein